MSVRYVYHLRRVSVLYSCWRIRTNYICFKSNESILYLQSKQVWSFHTVLTVPLSSLLFPHINLSSLSFSDEQITGGRWWCSDDEGVVGMQWNGAFLPLAGLKNRKHTLLYQQHTQLCCFTGECVCDYICILLNVRVGTWGVTICHSGIISHVCVIWRDCEGHLCCFWQSGFSSHIKMIILWSSSPLVVGSVLPEVQDNIH